MLDGRVVEKAKEILGSLTGEVKLIAFTQEIECMFCRENTELVKDVASISDRISFELYNFILDKEPCDKYGIDKVPAIVVTSGNEDSGIRFFGVPSGYEFVSLLEAIKLVSTGNHGLSEDIVSKIQSIKKSVHIQVFVTPTCPYCPKVVILAHKLAYLSKNIRSDMVEAIEFPHLANRYNVSGVPKSIINETIYIEGAFPERSYVDRIIELLK